MNMRQLWCLPLTIALAGCSGKSGGDEIELKGSGSTFVEPLCKKWCGEFAAKHKSITVSYGGGGSGKGIGDFTKGLTTFGASDAAMSDDEIDKVPDRNVVLIPVAAGEVVIAYNLDGVDDLKLSRETYAGIFMGEIAEWNHKKIKADNPNAKLPNEKITVYVRSDGSGTTYAFTNHLSTISGDFKKFSGARKEYKKPEGFKAAKGNSAVMGQIKNTPGSIGYVEYGFAKESKTTMARLENKAGKFVAPTPAAGQAALAGEKFPDDMRLFIADPTDKKAWPIVSYVWFLVKKKQDEKTGKAMKDFIQYCLTDGQAFADELGYLELPESVRKEIWAYADRSIK